MSVRRLTQPRGNLRHGFTLLELLAAIAIVLVLIALSLYGFNSMQNASRRKLTTQMLESCLAVFREYERATLMKGVSTQPVVAPGLVAEDATDRTGPAVKKTHEMMGLFRGIPVSQKALAQIPSDQVIPPSQLSEGPVLLDGWRNPIIFVPSGGLQNVKAGGGVTTVKSPDSKPFFVSAGPDGSFETGDDNVYSFEN